jgi:uncharacterized membrane protein
MQSSKLFTALNTSRVDFGKEFQKQKRDDHEADAERYLLTGLVKMKIVVGYIPSDLPLNEFSVAICSYIQATHMNNGCKRKGFRRISVRIEVNESN